MGWLLAYEVLVIDFGNVAITLSWALWDRFLKQVWLSWWPLIHTQLTLMGSQESFVQMSRRRSKSGCWGWSVCSRSRVKGGLAIKADGDGTLCDFMSIAESLDDECTSRNSGEFTKFSMRFGSHGGQYDINSDDLMVSVRSS